MMQQRRTATSQPCGRAASRVSRSSARRIVWTWMDGAGLSWRLHTHDNGLAHEVGPTVCPMALLASKFILKS